MTVQEVADKLVGYCRTGQFDNAMNELYGKNIVSIEPKGAPMEKAEGFGDKDNFYKNIAIGQSNGYTEALNELQNKFVEYLEGKIF